MVVLLGLNLMQVWYITTPATIFGIVAYVITFMTYFSEDGELCAQAQVQRGQYLLVEMIASWFFIICDFLPFFVMCMKKESHDQSIRKKAEDDDDEEEEEEK